MRYPITPDGRYFVADGRLWRCTRPDLDEQERTHWVRELMSARRALRGARHPRERLEIRRRIDAAKRALGERGPVWWTDGAPDYNQHLVHNTPYAEWYERLQEVQETEGAAPGAAPQVAARLTSR